MTSSIINVTEFLRHSLCRNLLYEKGLQHESAKKYRLSLAANMYLHARNADVDTFSEINIMKFNGGLMTDICIFERYTSGIFNLCCSGEMKRNVKLSNSTPQSKFFLKKISLHEIGAKL